MKVIAALSCMVLTCGALSAKSEYSNYLRNSKPYGWMTEEIQSVSYKAPTISLSKVGKKTLENHVHIRVKNGKLKISSKAFKSSNKHLVFRAKMVEKFFSRLCQEVLVPDVECLVTLEDNSDESDTKQSLPVLAFAKHANHKNIFAIPDPEAMHGYSTVNKTIKKARDKSPWSSKKNVVFWRGSTTGGIYNKTNWMTFPRVKLVKKGIERPDIVNAKFVNFCQGAEGIHEFSKNPDYKSGFIKPEDSIKYKYLIDVDGNTCTYPRLFWILTSGCLLIKHDSPYVQWFYKGIKPGQHFIGVKRDVSNLLDTVEWAKKHDDECLAIAKRGRLFADNNLQMKHQLLYTYHLLKHIHAIQKN